MMQARGHGFTLPETALSVALAATVILTLVSFIPPGLDQMRHASLQTAEARILQAVAAEYQMLPWQDILLQQEEAAERGMHFDDQGARVPADDPGRLFTVRTTVEAGERLPGADLPNAALRRIIIRITDHADADAAFAEPRLHRRLSTLVAQTDRPPAP